MTASKNDYQATNRPSLRTGRLPDEVRDEDKATAGDIPVSVDVSDTLRQSRGDSPTPDDNGADAQ